MNESEFNQLAEQTLKRIETVLDQSEQDVDYNRSGNVLEIEFEDDSKIIINRHDINQEIWVAARSGGFHYAWKEQQWFSQRDNSELFEKLSTLFAEQGIDFQES